MPSAGTGIFLRSHIPATVVEGMGGATTHEVTPAWAIVVHVVVGFAGGLLVGSARMESTGSSAYLATNYARYLRVAQFLRYMEKPFLVAGASATTLTSSLPP